MTIGHKDSSGNFHPHNSHSSAIHTSDINSNRVKRKTNYKIMTRYGMDSVHCGDCLTRLNAISLPCPRCKKYTVHVYGKMLQNPQDERWTPSALEKHMEKNTIHVTKEGIEY